jgi:hypothetical protein
MISHHPQLGIAKTKVARTVKRISLAMRSSQVTVDWCSRQNVDHHGGTTRSSPVVASWPIPHQVFINKLNIRYILMEVPERVPKGAG